MEKLGVCCGHILSSCMVISEDDIVAPTLRTLKALSWHTDYHQWRLYIREFCEVSLLALGIVK
ncbi:hypothetical protein BDN71DRAFT_1453370 [Pleurotus eryngii]|uniref:Uncharacterized protein n=1 Tax=Pleurotus eryngii TaxID=5323 RepID=A0A9P5ZN66_PLEER|nr:hypothetical protein BDN71DRAFT_1453370 [Pleurotus eryngii]